EERTPDKILERLTQEEPEPEEAKTTETAEPEAAVDEERLEELLEGAEEPPAPEPAIETPPAADLDEANEKLAQLLETEEKPEEESSDKKPEGS
ncbi:MAG: hypothetical protein D6766_00595, partial [Verrucomicrobia bacterium]